MDLKQLDSKEIERVYNTHMKIDFPVEELKPLDIIQKLLEKQNYACYGLYEKNELQAYALLAIQKSYLLIDYYAVCSEHRNKGIGSKFLKLIKEQFKDYEGIMVEVEKVECAPNETEKTIRSRRIDFYKRNGMRMTSISILLFNVDFSIMCLCNDTVDDSSICEGLKQIYKEIVSEKLYSKYVKITY